MGVTIDEHIVKQYTDTIIHLSQQQGSKLDKSVLIKSGVVGEAVSFNFLDTVDLVERTSRHAETPRTSPDHSRRWATLTFWERAVLLDQADKVQVMTDPTSDYIKTLVNAAGRKKDALILEAALGTAKTGKTGSGSGTFPAANIIAVGTTGMTVEKIIEGKRLLGAGEVDPDLKVYVAITANQVADLLKQLQVTSADYNTVKPLQDGKVAHFMGCDFIPVSTSLVAKSSTTRKCVMWAEGGIGLAIGQDIKTRLSEEGDVSYAIQAYLGMYLGAVRLEDAKVIEIDCKEAA